MAMQKTWAWPPLFLIEGACLNFRRDNRSMWQFAVAGRSICRGLKMGGRVMILGMSLATFTMVHVIISLIAIVSGILVLFGILGSSRMPGLTAIFLLFTILTSATGFLIPPLLSEKLLPSHMIGILSLVLLAIACIALYGMQLAGAWRWIYAVTAMVSLYLNIFVLIIQGFLKVPALTALAPGNPPSGPVFAVVQGVVLLFFVLVIIGAIRRFRPTPTYA
jgi:hypothetical protein